MKRSPLRPGRGQWHPSRLRGARVALFGSLARGEADPGSDPDPMVEIDPAAGLDL